MNALILFITNLFPIVCVICATILIMKDKPEGWGWLLLMAAFSGIGGTAAMKLMGAG
ncbi:hypothetical protein ACQVP2_27385 [Methylobacterium aquaticum]|uniref:hypothetical protein n=1 Tax=Methylobacterium aquaticum TaxID=270351 RepID=UPI003D162840